MRPCPPVPLGRGGFALLVGCSLAACGPSPAGLPGGGAAPVAPPAPAATASPASGSPAPAPPAPASPTSPAPPPSPKPAAPDRAGRPAVGPQDAAWVFGAVEDSWRVDGEVLALYDVWEARGPKPAGTMTGRYVRVGGVVYGVHWDAAEAHRGLSAGQTVNLYPANGITCVDDPAAPGGRRCWRLMTVQPGDRPLPPLMPG